MLLRPLQSGLLTFLPPPVLPLHLPRFKTTAPTFPKSRLQIEVVTLTKRTSKDAVFEPFISELAKRMSPHLSVTSRWIKRENTLRAVSDLIDSRRRLILLDPKGALPHHSRHFTQLVYDELELGGSRLVFVIGDADGFSKEVRELEGRAGVRMMSLSPLTFTHVMVSAFLLVYFQTLFFSFVPRMTISLLYTRVISTCGPSRERKRLKTVCFCIASHQLTNLSQTTFITKQTMGFPAHLSAQLFSLCTHRII